MTDRGVRCATQELSALCFSLSVVEMRTAAVWAPRRAGVSWNRTRSDSLTVAKGFRASGNSLRNLFGCLWGWFAQCCLLLVRIWLLFF